MTHPLEPIFALQKKDRKLLKLMREIHDIPQRRNDIEAQLSGSIQRQQVAVDSKKHTEASLKQLELEVESIRERINRYKVQQMDAKTNDQYRAFVKEIGVAEREIALLEEKQIALMEALEKGRTIVAGCEERLNVEKEGIASELFELDERVVQLKEKMARLKADRMRAAEQCDKQILQRYMRIMNNKRDVAVVTVDAGGHCSGCHMKLPPQVVNDARNPTKLVGCNFCGRIVYDPVR